MNAAFGFNCGLFDFDAAGPAGTTVVIQASPDLQNWTPLQTNLMGSAGMFYFSDSQSLANPRQFYRAISP